MTEPELKTIYDQVGDDHAVKVRLMAQRCSLCDRRLGMHRFSDNRCPNTGWEPGNGQQQWMPRGWEFTR